MNNVKVAIIVLTYNEAEYVSQTLDSLLAQKCQFKYKIYVNDDGSKDGTDVILKKYAANYPNMIDLQINKKNLGISANYFNAIERSESDYIAECSGDDWWCDEYKLQKQVDYLESRREIGLVYTRVKTFSNGEYKELPLGKDSSFEYMVFNYTPFSALTVCFRRDLADRYIKEINPVSHKWCMEDLPMWMWMSQVSKFGYINDTTSVYRLRSGAATNFTSFEKEYNFMNGTYIVKDFFLHYFHKEHLLPSLKYHFAELFLDLYLRYNKPMDDDVLNCYYKYTIKDGKKYIKYMASKYSVLRNLYNRIRHH